MLIELLISVVIMTLMSTVVLSANSNMSARLQTDNLAHMIALTIREAQTRALSATAPIGVNDVGGVPGYGVVISSAQDENTTVKLFQETGASSAYNAGSATLPGFTLGKGYKISSLSARNHDTGQPASYVQSVSVYFHRPRPDAAIYYGTSRYPDAKGTQATITVRSPKGNSKVITVSSTGQISVQ